MRIRLILALLLTLIATCATAAPPPDFSLRHYLSHTVLVPQGGMSNPPIVFQNQGTPLGVSFTVNCSTGMSCSFVSGVMTLTATGGGGGFPRLDQVLDPTADKTFAMGNHLLSFSGSGDDGTHNLLTVTSSDNSFNVVLHVGPLESEMDPILNNFLPPVTAEFNAITNGTTAFGTGIGIESQNNLTNAGFSGGALEIATLLNPPSNADPTSGIPDIQILANDAGTHNVGTLRGISFQAKHTTTGTMAGIEGIKILSPILNGGSGVVASIAALTVDDQTGALLNWAIKTGLGKVEFGDSASAVSYLTATNCSSAASPATCGSAAAGSVAVPTGITPTLVVNTTAVTANSQILFTPDESLGVRLGVTCNSTIAQVAIEPIVTARTAATSFTIQYNTTITTNPICLSYLIIN